jgi:peroxiredoxin
VSKSEPKPGLLGRTARIAQTGFIVAASLLVYAFVATAKDGETRRSCSALCAIKPNYAAATRRAPDFELPNLAGQTVRLSDYRGKVVILNFWSKSCPPCLEEMPSLAQLAHQLKAHPGVALLTVTTDESAEDARQTLTSLLGTDIPFEVLVDSEARVVTDLFGTRLYPETWFIDPDGVIRARVDTARDWSESTTIELAESFTGPLSCGIAFEKGQARGPQAHLCSEMGR